MRKFILFTATGLTIIFATICLAEPMNFTWDHNTETDLKEYKFYEENTHVDTIPAGTNILTRDVVEGPHFWHVTAVDESLNESGPSNVIDNVPPEDPTSLRGISVNVNVNVEVN